MRANIFLLDDRCSAVDMDRRNNKGPGPLQKIFPHNPLSQRIGFQRGNRWLAHRREGLAPSAHVLKKRRYATSNPAHYSDDSVKRRVSSSPRSSHGTPSCTACAAKRAHAFLVQVHGLASFDGGHDDTMLVIFRTTNKETDAVIEVLQAMGVGMYFLALLCPADSLCKGEEFGSIDILLLQGTRPRLANMQPTDRKKFLGRRYRMRGPIVQFPLLINFDTLCVERLPLDEIWEAVDSQNHLTFNYLAFVFVAALISTVGLATDSAATVVASMLVSPLMGPIMYSHLYTCVCIFCIFYVSSYIVGLMYFGTGLSHSVLPFGIWECCGKECATHTHTPHTHHTSHIHAHMHTQLDGR